MRIHILLCKDEIYLHCRRTKDDRVLVWKIETIPPAAIIDVVEDVVKDKKINTSSFIKKFLGK
jgi:hypothetical protein